MKKYFLAILFVAFTVVAFAQNQEPYISRSLSAQSISDVMVETSGGSIAVTGVNPGDARIEVYISGNNGNNLSKDEIQKRLEESYNLDITASNNKLTAVAKAKNWKNMDWKRALNISFKIFVPQAVTTDLSTSGGSISLANLTGNQKFGTSGGSLNIDQVNGRIDGQTSGGSIHVANSSSRIDLSTSGGSIEAKNCKGEIKLATSGGSLRLDDLDGTINASTSGGSVRGENIQGELTAHTSGGSINLNNLQCSLETSTSGGSIHVAITSLGKYVKISNGGGDIELSLPGDKGLDLSLAARKIHVDELKNFSGKTNDDRIEGKLNGGGIDVNVQSGSGKIILSFNK